MELRFNIESLWGLLFWRHQNHDCTGLQNAKGRSGILSGILFGLFLEFHHFQCSYWRLEKEGRLIRSLEDCIIAG